MGDRNGRHGTEKNANPSQAGHDATGLKPEKSARISWNIVFVLLWLAITLALAGWWLVHGLEQMARISGSIYGNNDIARWHRMYLSEGATLIVLLFAGGGAMLSYIATEVRRTKQVRQFFATFTHDLKNSLTSLRLQAESLEEDLKETDQSKLARRLVKDTVRLSLQLENSLFLASAPDATVLHIEELDARDALVGLEHYWPDLEVSIDQGDAIIHADVRAFESIIKNLVQNSAVHGRATRVKISFALEGDGRVRICIADNGRGFSGEREKLGQMFYRHTSTSGSGIGLHLVKTLVRRMGGDLRIPLIDYGFQVEVILPGSLAPAFDDAEEGHL
jgi:signal transduction histidine kinase